MLIKNPFQIKGRSNKKEYIINISIFVLLILVRIYFFDQYRGVEKSNLIIILSLTDLGTAESCIRLQKLYAYKIFIKSRERDPAAYLILYV